MAVFHVEFHTGATVEAFVEAPTQRAALNWADNAEGDMEGSFIMQLDDKTVAAGVDRNGYRVGSVHKIRPKGITVDARVDECGEELSDDS